MDKWVSSGLLKKLAVVALFYTSSSTAVDLNLTDTLNYLGDNLYANGVLDYYEYEGCNVAIGSSPTKHPGDNSQFSSRSKGKTRYNIIALDLVEGISLSSESNRLHFLRFYSQSDAAISAGSGMAQSDNSITDRLKSKKAFSAKSGAFTLDLDNRVKATSIYRAFEHAAKLCREFKLSEDPFGDNEDVEYPSAYARKTMSGNLNRAVSSLNYSLVNLYGSELKPFDDSVNVSQITQKMRADQNKMSDLERRVFEAAVLKGEFSNRYYSLPKALKRTALEELFKHKKQYASYQQSVAVFSQASSINKSALKKKVKRGQKTGRFKHHTTIKEFSTDHIGLQEVALCLFDIKGNAEIDAVKESFIPRMLMGRAQERTRRADVRIAFEGRLLMGPYYVQASSPFYKTESDIYPDDYRVISGKNIIGLYPSDSVRTKGWRGSNVGKITVNGSTKTIKVSNDRGRYSELGSIRLLYETSMSKDTVEKHMQTISAFCKNFKSLPSEYERMGLL